MKKIVLCPNPERDRGFEYAKTVAGLLRETGAEPLICPLFGIKEEYIETGVRLYNLEEELRGADMMITFGGDGTMLHAARSAAPYGVPILGINMGRKGFMAEIERGQSDLIIKAVNGQYKTDRRMMLDVTVVRGESEIKSGYALNDVVVNGVGRMISMTVYGDGDKMTSFAGDGIVIATPTGSTAYSMSAGGPIAEPSAKNIIVTPICAHAMAARSFVLESGRCVTVAIGRLGSRRAFLTADGREFCQLESGDRIETRRSKYETKLVRVSDRSYYEIISEKLGEVR